MQITYKLASRSRLRLRVDHRDPAMVLAQGTTKRSYKPFAHAFGSAAPRKAALVVTAVNCHAHMVKALQAVQRSARLPLNGNGERATTRLALIRRYADTALSKVQS